MLRLAQLLKHRHRSLFAFPRNKEMIMITGGNDVDADACLSTRYKEPLRLVQWRDSPRIRSVMLLRNSSHRAWPMLSGGARSSVSVGLSAAGMTG